MRRIPSKVVVLATATACGVAACANIFGINPGVLEDGSVPIDGPYEGAPTDAGADVPFDGGYVNPDANYADCGSGARSVSADAGWFVSPTGTGDCSIGNPCGSLQIAISKASAANGGTIFLASGVYTGTLLFDSNSKPLAFQGGWDVDGGAWTPQCVSNAAIIASDGTQSYTVALDHTTNPIAFSLVEISNQPGAVPNETSLYGILALVPKDLTLDNVEILVGNAGAGNPGSGLNYVFDAGFVDCNNPSDGLNGSNGGNGSPGSTVATSSGFTSVPGSGGYPGSPGHTGTAGGKGSCGVCNNSCTSTSDMCDAGGGITCSVSGSTQCGNTAPLGCGGDIGLGGQPGTSGGSSVGIFLYQGTLSVTNGAISAGSGGTGGDGVMGAGGQPGQPGMAGSDYNCYGYSSCGGMCFGMMGGYCMPEGGTSSVFPGGAAGGDGGNGGSGGRGGGGAGGNSYDVYVLGASAVTLNGIKYAVSAPAPGGAAGGPTGASANTNDY